MYFHDNEELNKYKASIEAWTPIAVEYLNKMKEKEKKYQNQNPKGNSIVIPIYMGDIERIYKEAQKLKITRKVMLSIMIDRYSQFHFDGIYEKYNKVTDRVCNINFIPDDLNELKMFMEVYYKDWLIILYMAYYSELSRCDMIVRIVEGWFLDR